jgi:hypothetical protein
MKARLVFLIGAIASLQCAGPAPTMESDATRPSAAAMPLVFERNDGQAPPAQRFVVRAGDAAIGFGSSTAVGSFPGWLLYTSPSPRDA